MGSPGKNLQLPVWKPTIDFARLFDADRRVTIANAQADPVLDVLVVLVSYRARVTERDHHLNGLGEHALPSGAAVTSSERRCKLRHFLANLDGIQHLKLPGTRCRIPSQL